MSVYKCIVFAVLPLSMLAGVELEQNYKEVAKDKIAVYEIPITGDGDWTATTDATWVKVVRASSAAASKPTFRVTSCNYSTDVREAVIMVNELSYTVRQLAYDAVITPTSVEVGAAAMTDAGFVVIDVEEVAKATSGIAWTAKLDDPNCDWITLTPPSGAGDGQVSYRVSENTNTIERIGTLTIAGQRLTITQAAAETEEPEEKPVATLAPVKFTLSSDSQEVEVSLSAEASASWTIENPCNWVNVFSAGTGMGNAKLGLAIASNKSVYSRQGVLTIGGATLTIIQKGTTDYIFSTDPASGSFGYTGGTTSISVEASDDLDWIVTSLSPWLTIQTPRAQSGAGDATVKYQVALNTGLEPRTGALEFTAKIPHPEIEISRGLMQWKGNCQALGYAYNDAALRDAKVEGETEGVWFMITNHMNSIHRLFDLNAGMAGLYVTEENRLVLDDTDGTVVDLKFPVEQNVTYDLFMASSGTNTILYGGVQGCGAYRKLHESATVLKISGYGRSTKPSNTTSASEELLIWGTVSTTAYYYWTRMLNASEMLNMPTEKPSISMPSDSVYTNLHSYAPMNQQFIRTQVYVGAGTHGYQEIKSYEEMYVGVSNIIYEEGRSLLRQSALSGDLIFSQKQNCIRALQRGYFTTSGFYEGGSYAYCYYADNLCDFYDSKFNYVLWDGNIPRISRSCSYGFWMKRPALEDVGGYRIFEVMRTSTSPVNNVMCWGWDWGPISGAEYYYISRVGTRNSYGLKYSAHGLQFVEDGVESQVFSLDGNSNEWILVTVTSSGEKMTLYADGKEIGNLKMKTGMEGFCLDLWCAYGNNGKFIFDDIKTFNACLSTDQVKEIYNLEKPLKFRHEVTQGAATPTLTETAKECASSNGVYSVGLTLPNSRIKWMASSGVDWIVLSETNGTGSATIHFTVAKNVETQERRGVITIAGIEYEVIQKGTGISFAKSIYEIAYDGTETLEIPVIASGEDTHWVVTEDPDRYWWLGTDTPDGYGSTSVSVWGAENSNEMDSRYGILIVSGVWLYVFQRDYELTVTPTTMSCLHAANTGEITVTTEEPDCGNWQAIADVDWIQLTGAEDGEVGGTGRGTVEFTLMENATGADRVGRIVVAGETCVITQKTKGVVTALVIDGPDSVLTGTMTNYVAKLVYSSGWSEIVTPTWSVPDCSTVTLSADGSWSAGSTSGEATINAAYNVGGVEWRTSQKVTMTLKPVKLEIAGVSKALCPGETRQLSYRVTYTDDSTGYVTPTGVSVTSGDATIDAQGVLVAGNITGAVAVKADYSVVGVTVSATYSTTIVAPTVQDALGSSLSFNTGSWKSVGATSHTGDYSMKAGPLNVGETVEMSVSVTGAGTLSCWLMASTAANANIACGEILIDGVVAATIKGVTDWTNVVCSVSTWGTHQIVWRYKKMVDGDCNDDCIWLDDVSWTATMVVPTELSIQGGDQVVVGGTMQYVCTVMYNNGSSAAAAAQWSVVSGSDNAEISAAGLLTAQKNGSVTIRASYTETNTTVTADKTVTVVTGLSSVSISGLAKLYAGDSTDYICTATYTDGSTAQVSPVWTLSSGSGCATLDANGTLTALDADGMAVVHAAYTYEGTTKVSSYSVAIEGEIAVTGDTTGGRPANVSPSWVYQYPQFKTKYGHDFEVAMSQPTGKKDGSGKELNVWHDYVAGTDPTDETDVFRAKVEMVDGLPQVSWEPNLNESTEERTYKVYGRKSLSSLDGWEYPANSAVHQFFKVDVAMPDDNDGGSDAPGEIDSWLSAVIPSAVSGLVYDGMVKYGVLSGTGYQLFNASATGAGDYVAIATLASGYRWADGSQTAQSIPWSIAKASNSWISEPTLAATSFLEGSIVTLTAGTPKFGTVSQNYTAAAIKSLTAGSYTLTSTVAGTANYAGLSHSIPFTVTAPDVAVAMPTAKSGLVYNGNTQYGVSTGTGYTVSGNSAINAGSYTATVTLKSGYAWSDGNASSSRTISWSIGKATNSWLTEPSISSTEFEEGSTVTIDFGSVKFGVRQANYTAAELASLPAGSYTFVVSVTGTANYSGLNKSISFTVTDGNNDKVATLPTGKSGLAYTGDTQIGVNEGIGYTIIGNTAVDVGIYKATATLKSGYVWSDGETAQSRTISWSIWMGGNSWLVQPSMSSTEFVAGSSVTISTGDAKFGICQANYTEEELAELTAGSYTLIVSVTKTDNYNGLVMSIPFIVTDPSLYCVVDLSGGPSATEYPVGYLSVIPEGGWADEYKTTKLVLRRIESGTFKMQGISNVTITKPFYIGVFEMTQRQYELIMGSNPSLYWEKTYGAGEDYPITCVSYDTIRGTGDGALWPVTNSVDATSFMGKIRKKTGLLFDLPTAAQWEYAARAGTSTTYFWGASYENNYLWYGGNSGNKLHAVGGKLANAWGLYDVAGNVSEWCLDNDGKLSYGNDPKGPVSSAYGGCRVGRGGSFGNGISDCGFGSGGYLYGSKSDYNDNYSKGFRICMAIEL